MTELPHPESSDDLDRRMVVVIAKARKLLAGGEAAECRECLRQALRDLGPYDPPRWTLRIHHHLARAEMLIARGASPWLRPEKIDYGTARKILLNIATLYDPYGDAELRAERDWLWFEMDRYTNPRWAESCLWRALREWEFMGRELDASKARFELLVCFGEVLTDQNAEELIQGLQAAIEASPDVRDHFVALPSQVGMLRSVPGVDAREGDELHRRMEVLARLSQAVEELQNHSGRRSFRDWLPRRKAKAP